MIRLKVALAVPNPLPWMPAGMPETQLF